MEVNHIEKAVALFKEGYNCSQAVFAAFSDRYGIPQEQAFLISASFGGGIGRMRETCGAACGMFMLAGLETGTTDPKDKEGKAKNYELVQELARKFRESNGSLNCAELLGLVKNVPVTSIPDDRDSGYYQKRPCAKIVEEAARIWHEYLNNVKK